MIVLGIETSCDETAVGLVDDTGRVLGQGLWSQIAAHRPYGGVVPEIAARAHGDHIGACLDEAFRESGLDRGDVDGVAATCGPGLIGGVMVGAVMGKALAAGLGVPFVAVNHLEAHALTVRLLEAVTFPYLVLLVSGGHCQLLIVRGVGHYRLLGTTLDDAAGECLDKGAAMLGLPYPGGPALEQAAKGGNPHAFDLPRPLKGRSDCAFSFSGLKTALRQRVEALTVHGPLSNAVLADLAASLQEAVADVVADRVAQALRMVRDDPNESSLTALVAAGGVASNATLRARLAALASTWGLPFKTSPPALCTDNGIMVAWAGLERLRLGLTSPLSTPARPRWPLESLAVESGN